MKKLLFIRNLGLSLVMLSFLAVPLMAQEVVMNIDEGVWSPWTINDKKAGKISGVLVEMFNKACEELDLTCTIKAVPWKRAKDNLKKGKASGLLGGSYSEGRASHSFYPPQADQKVSPSRLVQEEYVAVVYKDNSYNYVPKDKSKMNDDEKGAYEKVIYASLPSPVLAPKGWSIVKSLKKGGATVREAKTSLHALKMLLRDKNTSVVMDINSFNILGNNPKFMGKVRLVPTPLKSVSYFLVFSQKGNISEKIRNKLWAKTIELRDRPGYFDGLMAKY